MKFLHSLIAVCLLASSILVIPASKKPVRFRSTASVAHFNNGSITRHVYRGSRQPVNSGPKNPRTTAQAPRPAAAPSKRPSARPTPVKTPTRRPTAKPASAINKRPAPRPASRPVVQRTPVRRPTAPAKPTIQRPAPPTPQAPRTSPRPAAARLIIRQAPAPVRIQPTPQRTAPSQEIAALKKRLISVIMQVARSEQTPNCATLDALLPQAARLLSPQDKNDVLRAIPDTRWVGLHPYIKSSLEKGQPASRIAVAPRTPVAAPAPHTSARAPISAPRVVAPRTGMPMAAAPKHRIKDLVVKGEHGTVIIKVVGTTDIVHHKNVDGIVNPIASRRPTSINTMIQQAAGQKNLADYVKEHELHVVVGDAYITPSFGLMRNNVKGIVHIQLPDLEAAIAANRTGDNSALQTWKQETYNAYYASLSKASEFGLTSLAIPTPEHTITLQSGVESFCYAITSFAYQVATNPEFKETKLKEIHIIVTPASYEAINAYEFYSGRLESMLSEFAQRTRNALEPKKNFASSWASKGKALACVALAAGLAWFGYKK